MIVLDIWYTGFRTIFHTNSDYNITVKLLTMLCVIFTFFDLIEIWHKSSNYHIIPTTKPLEADQNSKKKMNVVHDVNESGMDLNVSKLEKKSRSNSDANTADSLENGETKTITTTTKNGETKTVKITQTKEIDAVAMLKKFEMNITIYKFSTKELKEEKKFSKNTLVLVTNYIYLLRVLTLHLLLIALPYAAMVQICLLLVVEISYCSNLVLRYLKVKHLKSLRFLVFKVAQSVFVIAIQLINLFIRFNSGDTNFPPSVSLQKTGMFLVLAALTCEYICFILSIIWMVLAMIADRKKKKSKKEQYIVYKQIKENVESLGKKRKSKKRLIKPSKRKGNPIRLMMRSVRKFRRKQEEKKEKIGQLGSIKEASQ